MRAEARAKRVRIGARKARLIARLIQGQPVKAARFTLQHSPTKAARLIEKVLESAVANAKEKGMVVADDLRVVHVSVDEGPRMKRIRPAPRGRALRILKRTSHIRVAVSDTESGA
ncbi:MAG: 50S ribosomal protein L22 [bacterium]|nr:50S ribosomal protein L22 [bacterium]